MTITKTINPNNFKIPSPIWAIFFIKDSPFLTSYFTVFTAYLKLFFTIEKFITLTYSGQILQLQWEDIESHVS